MAPYIVFSNQATDTLQRAMDILYIIHFASTSVPQFKVHAILC